MSLRTASTTVTFSHPFSMAGIDGVQPAGTYTIETEEELIEGLSFPAYRRISTVMLLPGPVGGAILIQAVTVDPEELRAALRKDSLDA